MSSRLFRDVGIQIAPLFFQAKEMVARDDLLGRMISFLQKREGIDKTLKLIRYSTKLLLASQFKNSTSDISRKLKSFEKSVGTSRKAFKLGKFLQNVQSFQELSMSSECSTLSLFSAASEGLYYFIEQFVWLVRAGAISKNHEPQLILLSAWAELLSYLASIPLKILEVLKFDEREKVYLQTAKEVKIINRTDSEIATLQKKKFLKILSIFQDFCDGFLALSDIRKFNIDPIILAAAGLISALISAHKNWTTSKK